MTTPAPNDKFIWKPGDIEWESETQAKEKADAAIRKAGKGSDESAVRKILKPRGAG